MVEDVGRFHPEFDRLGFLYFEAFAETAVKSPRTGRFDHVLTEVAANSGLRVLQNDVAGGIRDCAQSAHGPQARCDGGTLGIGDFLVAVAEVVPIECTALPLDLPIAGIEGAHTI